MTIQYARRLPLSDTNMFVSDLGGYAASKGKITQFGRLLRGGDPSSYTKEDIEYLKEYGVSSIIDLRSPSELDKNPHQMAEEPDILYTSCSMFDLMQETNRKVKPESLAESYIAISINFSAWVKQVLEAIAKNPTCVLFNCTNGCDRAGIIGALLLGAAGVCETDILVDYAVSNLYYCVNNKEAKKRKTIQPMEELLSHFQFFYGGIDGYFAYIGLETSTQEAICNILLKQS